MVPDQLHPPRVFAGLMVAERYRSRGNRGQGHHPGVVIPPLLPDGLGQHDRKQQDKAHGQQGHRLDRDDGCPRYDGQSIEHGCSGT